MFLEELVGYLGSLFFAGARKKKSGVLLIASLLGLLGMTDIGSCSRTCMRDTGHLASRPQESDGL